MIVYTLYRHLAILLDLEVNVTPLIKNTQSWRECENAAYLCKITNSRKYIMNFILT